MVTTSSYNKYFLFVYKMLLPSLVFLTCGGRTEGDCVNIWILQPAQKVSHLVVYLMMRKSELQS